MTEHETEAIRNACRRGPNRCGMDSVAGRCIAAHCPGVGTSELSAAELLDDWLRGTSNPVTKHGATIKTVRREDLLLLIHAARASSGHVATWDAAAFPVIGAATFQKATVEPSRPARTRALRDSGMSLADIGRQLGVSTSRVQQLIKQAERMPANVWGQDLSPGTRARLERVALELMTHGWKVMPPGAWRTPPWTPASDPTPGDT